MKPSNRILVVDDNPAIHDDFQKILGGSGATVTDISAAEAALFGDDISSVEATTYDLAFASQGEEGLGKVEMALEEGRPFSLAFVDVRMPPGWDGIETISRIWKVAPDLQVVICTAYSDYSWEEMVRKLGKTDRLLILKKPFDTVEVHQIASAMTEKWSLHQQQRQSMRTMETQMAGNTGELQRSLSLTQATLDATADGILVVDQEGKITGFNKKFQAIWNLPPSLIESKHYESMLNAVLWQLKDPEEFSDKFKELTADLESESFDAVEFVDGRIFERYSQPQKVGDQNVGRVWSFRDITERTQLEQRFLRTQRMESIGALAGGVAHDLNNILSPIMVSAPLLREGLGKDEIDKLVNNIEVSAQRGAAIVKQLLAFGRGMEGEKVPVFLRHTVMEVTRIVEETFPRNISIQTSAPKDLWPVTGDPTHMHQVALNLCINARDAMPNGGTITMSAANVEVNGDDPMVEEDENASAGPFVVLKLVDSGCGISPQLKDKIFDPFFTTKELGRGSGLGLSTVLGIAKSHGGFIRVTSEVDQGSTFEVFIPATPEATPIEPKEKAPPEKGHGETILVVDDEPNVLEATAKLLEQNGYKVLTCRDGAEAVEKCGESDAGIQVVLTDVMMPNMDGATMMRRLTELAPGMCVVATSGLEKDERFDEMKELGLEAFLPKPYTPDKLLGVLRQVIDRSEANAG